MSIFCQNESDLSSTTILTLEDINNCPDMGYQVLASDASELYSLLGGQAQPTLYDLFTIPIASDLNQLFMMGLYIPLLAYMVSWGFGVVINWFTRPDEYS